MVLFGFLREIEQDCLDQMINVDQDINEHIQRLDLGFCDGNQAAVSVMDYEICANGHRRDILNAARAVAFVSDDHHLLLTSLRTYILEFPVNKFYLTQNLF